MKLKSLLRLILLVGVPAPYFIPLSLPVFIERLERDYGIGAAIVSTLENTLTINFVGLISPIWHPIPALIWWFLWAPAAGLALIVHRVWDRATIDYRKLEYAALGGLAGLILAAVRLSSYDYLVPPGHDIAGPFMLLQYWYPLSVVYIAGGWSLGFLSGSAAEILMRRRNE